ncbi:hypothetical protein TSUD_222400 [Trifolium subterraneum]|uniref:Uncharacterized protein n=1 Tax=Trifolium subterraneum TaxID=3900 RepID=A0A2Z6MKK0_TRISU|nr:hypothetical protein TSUD_222400 [Trifolium subterraneum]
MVEDWACALGPSAAGDVGCNGPAFLRTRQGDFPIQGSILSNPFIDGTGGVESKMDGSFAICDAKGIIPPIYNYIGARKSGGYLHRQTNTMKRRISKHKAGNVVRQSLEEASDSIHYSNETSSKQCGSIHHTTDDSRGFGLEVVLPCANNNFDQTPVSPQPLSFDRHPSHGSIENLGVTKRVGCRISCWMGFILKERFKGLKVAIKEWNSEAFGKPEEKKRKLVAEILALDYKSEVVGLSHVEVALRKVKFQELWRLL